MKISGFTFVKNADKFYFPIKESIESILPIVDEFIIAYAEGDEDDQTLEKIQAIDSPKIKIYHREWDPKDFVDGKIYRTETNFALSKCSGDWCFYLQADEVIREDELDHIVAACQQNLKDDTIDGLLFKYLHFWGDYDHYLPYHGWYRREIRLIKNNRKIYSIKDAQSFRKENNQKLTVKELDAHVHHYGWVRPPQIMKSKKKEQDEIHWGKGDTEKNKSPVVNGFDYGPLGNVATYRGKHPKVMNDFIQNIFWKEDLNYTKQKRGVNPVTHKHEKTKYRILSWIENTLLGGRGLFGYSNWILKK